MRRLTIKRHKEDEANSIALPTICCLQALGKGQEAILRLENATTYRILTMCQKALYAFW